MSVAKKKIMRGKVVSDKMKKTIVVDVERLTRHPFYEKVIRRTTRLFVDNPENQAKIGDEVEVIETRPLSKMKRWKLLNILKKAQK